MDRKNIEINPLLETYGRYIQQIDQALDNELAIYSESEFIEPLKYSLEGGKRIRPIILTLAAESVGKVDENTLNFFKMYCASADNVVKEHEQMYSYVEGKMKTLRLGLKSYRTFDQAKALADKVGVVLNETMLNESSSLALSIYSPENLASLLEDKEVLNRDQKIAIARKQMQQTVN